MAKQDKSEDKFDDIFSFPKPSFRDRMRNIRSKISTFFVKNHRRNTKAVLTILIVIVLTGCAVLGVYLQKMLSLINYSDGTSSTPDVTFEQDYYYEEEEESLQFQTMYDIEQADSLKDLLKTWATNEGEKLYSKYVINVLLIGEDDDEGSHRSDSCILASVNTKEKKITLCSFLRDSYTYMTINDEERYDKTNHSYSWGGASKLMEVISNNYKIKIDHFVSIDFQSFVKVIDILGGVTVPITEKEAAFMNRTTKIAGFEAGENVLLNGQRALIYSRIRKLDSEVERTRRQREVISSLVKNIKASSLNDLNKAIETFLPYVTTNYKASEILSYAAQAVGEGWMNYEITGLAEPSDELRYEAKSFRTYTGYLDVWVVDYIKAAQEVQLALYNKTNIEIDEENHISAVSLIQQSRSYSYSSGESQEEEETTRKRLIDWSKWKINRDED